MCWVGVGRSCLSWVVGRVVGRAGGRDGGKRKIGGRLSLGKLEEGLRLGR